MRKPPVDSDPIIADYQNQILELTEQRRTTPLGRSQYYRLSAEMYYLYAAIDEYKAEWLEAEDATKAAESQSSTPV